MALAVAPRRWRVTRTVLMWLGMLLFLLGLLTGLAEQRFTNVRMGLAAHLEGVMNGIFLVALGAIWTEVRLPSPAKAMAYWTACRPRSCPSRPLRGPYAPRRAGLQRGVSG
jgi:hypothetical protein